MIAFCPRDVLKGEGQIEDEELTKEREKRSERKVSKLENMVLPCPFPARTWLGTEMPKRTMFEEKNQHRSVNFT